MMENFSFTTEIINATIAAKNDDPNALQMCNSVAQKLPSILVGGSLITKPQPIWTLPKQQKYNDLSNNEKLYYCKSGQFIEDVKYAGMGNFDKVGYLLGQSKDIPDDIKKTQEEIKKELNETLAKQVDSGINKGLLILGVGIGTFLLIKILKK